MISRKIYIEQLKTFIDKPQIKILTGLRRSGKSSVLHLLKNELLTRGVLPEQVVFINLESFTFSTLRDATVLHAYVSEKMQTGKKMYLLLDEIQEVEQWEKAINSFLVDFDIDI